TTINDCTKLGTALGGTPTIVGRLLIDETPVRVRRGSEMGRPSPRRRSPRNKHEIGALSAVWAEGNRSDHRVLIVVRPRNGGVGAQDAIAERLAECLASSAPIASRPRAVAMP